MNLNLSLLQGDALTAFMRTFTEPVVITDREGMLLYSNPAFTKLIAHGPSARIGDIFLEPAGLPLLRDLSQDHPAASRVCWKSPSGNTMEGQAFVSAIRNEKEETTGYFVRVNPGRQGGITESADFLRFLENAPVAVYTCDLSGTITYYNKVARELWGRAPEPGEKWCGSHKLYAATGERIDLPDCLMAITVRQGVPQFGYEVIIERPDGQRLNVLPHPMPLYGRDGERIGAINLIIDISDRRLGQERLARMAAIVESSEDAIVSKNLDGIITSWNPAAERIFGFTAAEMIGRSILTLIPPELRDEETTIISRIKKGERVQHFDTVRVRKNGTRLNVSLTISPVRNEYGKIIGASKIARDVTSRKASEQALNEKTMALERINEELSQFAYVISHDLKAPLRAISSVSHFLLQDYSDKMDEEGRRQLRLISNRIQRMDNLIKGLLDYSRVGRTSEPPSLVKTSSIVKEIWRLLDPNPGIVLQASGLPDILFYRVPLYHILHNLLSNAVKHMGKDDGIVSVTCTVSQDSYVFCVRDSGPGIEKKYHARIFGIFQTLNGRDEMESTGIGLTIVKKTVENYGGNVWLESVPGKGSEFYFRVPAGGGS